jgi:hypothetical protein
MEHLRVNLGYLNYANSQIEYLIIHVGQSEKQPELIEKIKQLGGNTFADSFPNGHYLIDKFVGYNSDAKPIIANAEQANQGRERRNEDRINDDLYELVDLFIKMKSYKETYDSIVDIRKKAKQQGVQADGRAEGVKANLEAILQISEIVKILPKNNEFSADVENVRKFSDQVLTAAKNASKAAELGDLEQATLYNNQIDAPLTQFETAYQGAKAKSEDMIAKHTKELTAEAQASVSAISTIVIEIEKLAEKYSNNASIQTKLANAKQYLQEASGANDDIPSEKDLKKTANYLKTIQGARRNAENALKDVEKESNKEKGKSPIPVATPVVDNEVANLGTTATEEPPATEGQPAATTTTNQPSATTTNQPAATTTNQPAATTTKPTTTTNQPAAVKPKQKQNNNNIISKEELTDIIEAVLALLRSVLTKIHENDNIEQNAPNAISQVVNKMK